MKKYLLFVLIVVLAFFSFSCNNAVDNTAEDNGNTRIEESSTENELEKHIVDLESTIDSLDNSITELQKSNTKLEDENASLKEKLESAENELAKYKEKEKKEEEAKKIQVGDVSVTLTSKGTKPKNIDNYQFSDYVTMTFNVQNNTDKDIQGVQGVSLFKDLFGESIISIQCDFTGQIIPAHSSVEYNDLVLEVNEFMPTHTKLYTTDYKDLKFDYDVTCIVFTDGTEKK